MAVLINGNKFCTVFIKLNGRFDASIRTESTEPLNQIGTSESDRVQLLKNV